MSDHTFVAGSLRDLNKPVPRIALTGWRTRVPVPRPGLTFPVLLVAAGGWGLAVEAGNGWSSTVTKFGLHAPLAVVWGIAVLVGIGLFVQRARNPRPKWYRWWSLLDSREEAGGVRLVSNRVRADDPGIVVRRGDDVEVHATLIARHQTERTYAFRIQAPGGELTFDVPIFVEKLSMAPLDELAARWGFTVSVHDDAARIRRAEVGGISR